MTTTTKNDPMALAFAAALIGLAFFAGFAHIGPPQAQAQQIIIVQATPTPALPTFALAPVVIELAQPTPAPAMIAPAVEMAVIEAVPVQVDVAPQIAPENAAQEAAPTIDPQVLQATEDARAQAAEQAAIDQAVNNPDTNGGNVAPEGCPFPIINGRCANGVLAKSVGESAFGSKSIADTGSDPQHTIKVTP